MLDLTEDEAVFCRWMVCQFSCSCRDSSLVSYWHWTIGPILEVYGMRLTRDHGDHKAADGMEASPTGWASRDSDERA